MNTTITMKLSLPRTSFFCGEAIPLAIWLHNGTASAVAVPVPFAPSRAELRFTLQLADRSTALRLGPVSPVDVASVGLPAGGFYSTELSLTEWHAFEPGPAQLDVEWTVTSGLTVSASIALELLTVQDMAMTLAPALADDDPFSVQAVAVLAATGLRVLSDRRFVAEVDDDSQYRADHPGVRWFDDGPAASPVAVIPGPSSQAWVVAAADHGLQARPGFEVQGAAQVVWTEGSAVELVMPAIERADGELLVYSLRGVRGDRHLVQTRFGLPVVGVEPATGPDDWDDEVLLPGPVTETRLCPVDEGACSATLVAESADEHRVLALSTTATGGVLLHARLREGSAPDFVHVDLPGSPLPHARPSAFVDPAGHLVAVLLLSRPGNGGRQVVVVLVDLDDDTALPRSVLALGTLPTAPRSCAISSSRRIDEAGFFRCAVICTDGTAWLGDSTGRWEGLGQRDDWLVPLALTTQRDHAHIAVRTAHGPSLVRLVPGDALSA